jgi:hypothetical protein
MCQLGDCRFGAQHHGDDTHVATRPSLLSIVPGAVCLIAVVMMSWAAFLPFIGWWGDSLNTAVNSPEQNAQRLAQGSDASLVLGTLLILAMLAVSHAAGIRRHITAIACLGASAAILSLALKLPGTYEQDGVTYGQPMALDAGFYLFVCGAVVAVIAALVMMVMRFRRSLRTISFTSTTAGGTPS